MLSTGALFGTAPKMHNGLLSGKLCLAELDLLRAIVVAAPHTETADDQQITAVTL
ncbi:hypothetical protein [Dyella sp.]|uniref:hypothetical protein n=1 Tax=Dyella sp. TaxID=1869338 RepID=UPI00284276BA|nr:hypothetical protein [Dyella sp.]MDR3446669.1 hypothetical protein [Dyella sp.]